MPPALSEAIITSDLRAMEKYLQTASRSFAGAFSERAGRISWHSLSERNYLTSSAADFGAINSA
jgi:hypothetical protein